MPTGATGPIGPAGADGTTFTPQSPLALFNGILSIDLSAYAQIADIHPKVWAGDSYPHPAMGGISSARIDTYGLQGIEPGDYVLNQEYATLARAENVSGGFVSLRGEMELEGRRGIIPTTGLDLDAGVRGSSWMNLYGAPAVAGTLILNTSTGALMKAISQTNWSSGYATVTAEGIGNVFGGGSSLTAQSPLDITNDVISIDLSSYATQNWVTQQINAAIANLDDLSEVSF